MKENRRYLHVCCWNFWRVSSCR